MGNSDSRKLAQSLNRALTGQVKDNWEEIIGDFNNWNDVNSLTAMGAHERPLFNKLRGSVVSRRVFIRSQSLIAR